MKKNESRAESSRIEQSHVYVELLKRRHRRGVEISFRVGRFFLESSLLTAELLSILIRFRFPSITASLFRRRRKARYKPKKREIKAIDRDEMQKQTRNRKNWDCEFIGFPECLDRNSICTKAEWNADERKTETVAFSASKTVHAKKET